VLIQDRPPSHPLIGGLEKHVLVAYRCAEFPDRLHDELNRTLDDRCPTLGGIEVPAPEKLAEDGRQSVLRSSERLGHSFDDLPALRIRTSRSIVDEESIELLAKEYRRFGAREQDVHEVVAVECAPSSEDQLLAGVVSLLPKLEGIVGEGESGQGSGALPDVRLGVTVPFAQYEEFHQFAGEILVGSSLLILIAVEILEHRGIPDD
jgi:hypothetical protein